MPIEHALIGLQHDIDTWPAALTGLEVETFTTPFERKRADLRTTGRGRGLSRAVLTSKAVSGDLTLPAWDNGLGVFFKALGMSLKTTTPAGATLARAHNFLMDDSVGLAYLAAQVQRDNGTTTQNILGMAVNTLTLTATAEEVAMLSVNYIAKDEVMTGDTWDYDGSAAPAKITPVTYVSTLPYVFYQGALVSGGTVTKGADDELTVAGGTQLLNIQTFEISVENNISPAYFILNDPTAQRLPGQDRAINIRFDADQSDGVDTSWYTNARGGTQLALQLTFVGGIIEAAITSKLIVTIPLVDVRSANLPDISGSNDRRVKNVEAVGLVHSTLNTDLGVTIVDTVTSYDVP